MIDLSAVDQSHLKSDGWQTIMSEFKAVTKARTDPSLFRQVERFKRHLRNILSIAAELNSNQEASIVAFEHVKSTKILARNKTINQFEDIQQQTYDICMQALQRDMENMYNAFCDRNMESLEDQYRQVTSWPVRYAG